MRKYALERILTAVFTLLVILLVLFILMQLISGSPFNDEKLNAEQRILLYVKYGLDQPVVLRLFGYVLNMPRGDFGVSYNTSKNMPIARLIAQCFSTSIGISGMVVAVGALVGLLLGLAAALNRGITRDSLTTVTSVVGVSVSPYVFALVLSFRFGFKSRWFPMPCSTKEALNTSILPSIVPPMFTLASIVRFIRSEMVEALDNEYMLLTESKGLSGGALPSRYTLRNALISIITVLASLIVDLITGSFVVEKVFAIPGIGSLLVNTIQGSGYNIMVSLSFIYSMTYTAVMLTVDILYGIIDPRIRLAEEGG